MTSRESTEGEPVSRRSSPPVAASWRGWPDLPLTSKLEVLLAALLLVAVTLTVVQYAASRNLARALEERDVGRKESALLRDLQVALYNVQSGQRAYLLSGRSAYLEPFVRGRSDAQNALGELAAMKRLPVAIEELARATGEYVEGWAQPSLTNLPAGRLTPEQQRALAAEGTRRLDVVVTKLAKITATVERDFSAARQATEGSALSLSWLPWASLALLMTALLGLRYGLAASIVRPLVRLRDATASLAEGDYSVRVPVGSRDEVGQLASTFNATAAAIERGDAALKERTRELERSNRELEQFAYVASHDLQEPLRMVSSYTQLLARRYSDKLDERAEQYIHFAVDGANRMQRLIEDLLTFSRVGTRGGELKPVDANEVVSEVLLSLRLAIGEANAVIEHEALPMVLADSTQLAQLLQNLIGNALKFRREDVPPEVGIEAERQDEFWRFTVRDNGIGIDPQYFERIFIIFQRLHGKDEFGGSGIGLAVCKKIVERHGGHIWVDSRPGEGSAFHFTLQAV